MLKPRLSFIICCLLVSSGALFPTTGRAGPVSVEQALQTGNIRWVSAYDVDIRQLEILIEIRVSLLVPNAVNRALFERRSQNWREAISAKWNQRFSASIGERVLPIRFDVRFTHHRPHHRVVIHPGQWIPNQHNWYMDTPPAVVAHEIGHMLGAYDEYSRGALAPENALIDDSSIMGASPDSGLAYSRHLSSLKENLKRILEGQEIRLYEY